MTPPTTRRTPAEPTGLIARLRGASDRLTPAERKVADVVVDDPQIVAFGTVADVARRAGASGASVVRLATRLGYSGFSELQSVVQAELGRRLRPATERIREPASDDLLERTTSSSIDAIAGTIDHVDRASFEAVVKVLASRAHRVWTLAGDASAGIMAQFATELSMLRPGVAEVHGSGVAVARQLASVAATDTVIALDLRRYDRWLVEAASAAATSGVRVIALTDSPMSPLARLADHVFVVEGDGVGPFDNYVGALALLSALSAGAARQMRSTATAHLDRIEAAWRDVGALTD